MSTSLSPRSAPVHPARQQLDELDALLQRMLDLPVNRVEEETVSESPARKSKEAPPAASRDAKAPIPSRGPSAEFYPEGFPGRSSAEQLPGMTRPPAMEPETSHLGPRLLKDSAPPEGGGAENREGGEDEEDWVPLRSSWQPSSQTWGPLAKQWQEAQQSERPTRKAGKKAKTGKPKQEQPLAEPVNQAVAGPSEQKESSETAAPARDGDAEIRPPAPFSTSWQVDANPADEPLPPPPVVDRVQKTANLPPPTETARFRPTEQTSSSHDVPPLPWPLWPFAAVDYVFDLLLSATGPLGRPLRGRRGKSFLGAIGALSLIAAAGLWAADWFGWTW